LVNGADHKIKNYSDNLPIDEALTEDVRYILKKHDTLYEQDEIMKNIREYR